MNGRIARKFRKMAGNQEVCHLPYNTDYYILWREREIRLRNDCPRTLYKQIKDGYYHPENINKELLHERIVLLLEYYGH